MAEAIQAIAALGSLAFLVTAVALLALALFWIVMVFDVATTPHLPSYERFLWMLVVLGFWAVGALVYMVYGRRAEQPPPGPRPVLDPDPAYFQRVQERLSKAKQEGYGGRAGA